MNAETCQKSFIVINICIIIKFLCGTSELSPAEIHTSDGASSISRGE